ncbi:diguanylate cyclase (GGDEF)-like protein [Inhella inkyongensis]|uniref:diguanylate cyclase n=1 Tax=Inhella inkyongensis TaxID=392593 RepID=A0A840S7I9_9BURK|nr:diguanylate cyclase [Inhella inkyongensis]MBB5204976.1 diguanylate cyclase (GGDEF)-like protein [Inhella inkyongensis]
MEASILIVDDEPGSLQVLGHMLEDLAEIQVATSGAEALALAEEAPPALILLDAQMPGMNGFEVCARLKAQPRLADIPVIFVTANASTQFEVASFELGAADFIAKPVIEPTVRARVKTQLQLKEMTDRLRRTATEDGLTGLANRRHFDESLMREVMQAQRSGSPLVLCLADVDRFKAYNDCYGHPAGDRCLQAVARALRSVSQHATDLVARYGGEEFALLLPHTSLEGAALVAARAQSALEMLGLPNRGVGPDARVTLSMGVACFEPPRQRRQAELGAAEVSHQIVARLLESADQALYAAKHAGRNRSCTASPAGDGSWWVAHPDDNMPTWRPLENAGA